MTRDELKTKVTPILCNLDLTKEERSNLLGPIFIEFIPEALRDPKVSTKAVESYAEIWNHVIFEIVEENNLAADGKGIKH